jgi:hypothetical protein
MKNILCSLFATALAATAADKPANWPQWRKASSKDKRLRALYDGERGLPFVRTELL